MKRFPFVLLMIVVLVSMVFAGKKKDQADDQSCDLKIKVFKESNGKPVRNASVVLHPVNAKGKQGSAGMDLKTDENGEASISAIPYGTMRVQVISHELQTYGDDIVINQPQQEVVVKMKPPQKQYSIYEHGATTAPNTGDDPSDEKKDDQKK
jgi:hypothetical protein